MGHFLPSWIRIHWPVWIRIRIRNTEYLDNIIYHISRRRRITTPAAPPAAGSSWRTCWWAASWQTADCEPLLKGLCREIFFFIILPLKVLGRTAADFYALQIHIPCFNLHEVMLWHISHSVFQSLCKLKLLRPILAANCFPSHWLRAADWQASGCVPSFPCRATGCFGFVLSRLLHVRNLFQIIAGEKYVSLL